MYKPTKAVIAVAGYGTRRLPIAKAVDKCMMPLLNRPVVDYIVQDVIAAGVHDVYFVVSGDARQLRDYYTRDGALEAYLRRTGKAALVPLVTPPKDVRFHFIEQDRDDPRYGTSVPAWLAQQYVESDETFFYIMGDQTLWREDGRSECALLLRQVTAMGAEGGMIGVPVPREEVYKYGVIAETAGHTFCEIIEKPQPATTPSTLNNASIYLLPNSLLAYLGGAVSPQAGEWRITDVLNAFAADGHRVTVRASDAVYLDCGSVEGWVAANSFLLGRQQQGKVY